MKVSRISASSYSNTAPLIWSFLYGTNRGKVEVILDTAPSRSAELLAENRVDAALVPVIAYQLIENVRLFPHVCVGAKEKVKSVCLVTKGEDLVDVKSVSLDVSSKTSVVLTKIIFREFLNREPIWSNSPPDLDAMLSDSDCALLIGDPALMVDNTKFRVFDLAEVWKNYTNFGFVFAMWMTQRETCEIDFVSARDEGLTHLDEIIANYENEIPLSREQFNTYLTENIAFAVDESMQNGLQLYYQLAQKHKLIERNKPLIFLS
jgi:chorismate dehydratase